MISSKHFSLFAAVALVDCFIILSLVKIRGAAIATSPLFSYQSDSASLFRTGSSNTSGAELIACWGDSLTAGAGADHQNNYPELLGRLLEKPVFNGGVGGETSTQIKKRMLNRAPGLDQGVTIIWAGRNNFPDTKTVERDIAEMVASLPKQAHYLVMGIINGDSLDESKGQPQYERLMALNADLAAVYKDRFVPVHQWLVSNGSGSAIDVTDQNRDVTPSSLRSDDLHLNARGYMFVARELKNYIKDRNF